MIYKQKQDFIALSLIVQMTIEVYVSEKSGTKNQWEKEREVSLLKNEEQTKYQKVFMLKLKVHNRVEMMLTFLPVACKKKKKEKSPIFFTN